jgi:uncharacterized protein involved in exopolysaccharide biosynthesis
MSANTLVRLVDSFMRRWWLYLVPVLLLAGFGALTASATQDSYRSIGTLSVSSATLVDKISGNSPNFGYDTAAEATTKQLSSQLQTEQFVTDIVDRAGLKNQVASGAITTQQVRGAIAVFPEGANLFHVVATFRDPVVAQRLAQATMDAFNQGVLDANLADSASAIAFYDNQATTYAADVTAAQKAVTDFLNDNPCAADCDRTRSEADKLKIEQLNQAVALATTQYTSAVTKREEAKLTSDQLKSEVGSRLVIVDKPEVPVARQPKLKGMILTFAMFVVLGLIIATGAVVVATALDQGVRVASDLRDRLGVRALAAVPDAGTIPVVTGMIGELPRRATTATAERAPRRGEGAAVAQTTERGVRRALEVVEQQAEPEPAPSTHGPRRIGVRPSGTSPVGNARRPGPIGHGRRSGID